MLCQELTLASLQLFEKQHFRSVTHTAYGASNSTVFLTTQKLLTDSERHSQTVYTRCNYEQGKVDLCVWLFIH